MPEGDSEQHSAYSRKDKSLGLLCESFLNMYGNGKHDHISLDAAATRLGVERRRIYDIVNVLESVEVVVRKEKNKYTWHGMSKLPRALAMLKETGLREFGELTLDGSREVDYTPPGSPSVASTASGSLATDLESLAGDASGETAASGGDKPAPAPVPARAIPRCGERREKSLGLLSQKFVQLFLVSPTRVVSLEEAAKILLGNSNDAAKLKTKVRRLYDIANILASLNLIEKTHLVDSRKPAFKWLHGTAAAGVGAPPGAAAPEAKPALSSLVAHPSRSPPAVTAAPGAGAWDHLPPQVPRGGTASPAAAAVAAAASPYATPAVLHPLQRHASVSPTAVPDLRSAAPLTPLASVSTQPVALAAHPHAQQATITPTATRASPPLAAAEPLPLPTPNSVLAANALATPLVPAPKRPWPEAGAPSGTGSPPLKRGRQSTEPSTPLFTPTPAFDPAYAAAAAAAAAAYATGAMPNPPPMNPYHAMMMASIFQQGGMGAAPWLAPSALPPPASLPLPAAPIPIATSTPAAAYPLGAEKLVPAPDVTATPATPTSLPAPGMATLITPPSAPAPQAATPPHTTAAAATPVATPQGFVPISSTHHRGVPPAFMHLAGTFPGGAPGMPAAMPPLGTSPSVLSPMAVSSPPLRMPAMSDEAPGAAEAPATPAAHMAMHAIKYTNEDLQAPFMHMTNSWLAWYWLQGQAQAAAQAGSPYHMVPDASIMVAPTSVVPAPVDEMGLPKILS